MNRILTVLVLALGLPWAAWAGGLVSARDLAADAREAQRLRAPILIFFAADSCPYCHEVENLYLGPMQASDDYRGKLIIRVVHVGRGDTLVDFDGRTTTHRRFADRRDVWFTPLIHFYDPQGRELEPALVGYTTPDFYGEYLSRSVSRARASLLARGAPAPESRLGCTTITRSC